MPEPKETKATLELTAARRGFFYEEFNKELDKFIKIKYGRQSMGATMRALLKEAVRFYCIHMDVDVKETKGFPKKGEPVKKFYEVSIELATPGLNDSPIIFKKSFDKITVDNK